MDIQKVASTGTAVAVIGGGSIFGGNYAIDQATGGPDKRIKAKQSELQLIVREEVRAALRLAKEPTVPIRAYKNATTAR